MSRQPLCLRVSGQLAVVALSVVLSGCVNVKLSAPSASVDVVRQMKTSVFAPAQVGRFEVAPGKDPLLDKKVGGLRGSSITPESGSYSHYLKDELVAALKAAGLYQEDAAVVIEGQLTDSQVDAAIGTGTARLAARFLVRRAGGVVYDKELAVDSKWESSFLGPVAIPAAVNQYTALYKSLIVKLFSDNDFKAAMAP